MKNDYLNGQIFGYLKVLSREYGHKRATYICECTCGKVKKVRKDHLKGHKINSCGCKRGDIKKETFKKKNYISPFYKQDNYAAKTKIYSRYKADAAERDIEFNLSLEDFISVITLDCTYCGKASDKISQVNQSRSAIYYTGIDRKDNSRGYITNNITSCCTECNMIKNSLITYEEMLEVSKLLKKLREKNEND